MGILNAFLLGGFIVLIIISRKLNRRVTAIEATFAAAAKSLEPDLHE